MDYCHILGYYYNVNRYIPVNPFFWGHILVSEVASLTPVHGAAGLGFWNLNLPIGGSAYRIPTVTIGATRIMRYLIIQHYGHLF